MALGRGRQGNHHYRSQRCVQEKVIYTGTELLFSEIGTKCLSEVPSIVGGSVMGFGRSTFYKVAHGDGNAYIAKVKSAGFPVSEDDGIEFYKNFKEAKKALTEKTRLVFEDARDMHRIARKIQKGTLPWEQA